MFLLPIVGGVAHAARATRLRLAHCAYRKIVGTTHRLSPIRFDRNLVACEHALSGPIATLVEGNITVHRTHIASSIVRILDIADKVSGLGHPHRPGSRSAYVNRTRARRRSTARATHRVPVDVVPLGANRKTLAVRDARYGEIPGAIGQITNQILRNTIRRDILGVISEVFPDDIPPNHRRAAQHRTSAAPHPTALQNPETCTVLMILGHLLAPLGDHGHQHHEPRHDKADQNQRRRQGRHVGPFPDQGPEPSEPGATNAPAPKAQSYCLITLATPVTHAP
ncbi:MAG: hypothetical protein J0I11_01670 [Actinobacteria bacterium]|nr:hypothetical protein [Actinomycetota bacterium]